MLKLRRFSVRFVLPDGEMAGAGQKRSSAAAGDPDFFMRSASK
jgi:hypothetical protein